MKKVILPAVAGVIALAAAAVVFLVPGKGGSNDLLQRNNDGTILIRAAALSSEKVSFIRIADDSKIELLARLGDDGTAKVALGTCQSCNGAPGAYYTQEGDALKCNNCGLTFPLEVIDTPGGGCHPMIPDEEAVSYSDGNAVVNTAALSEYEPLFEKVADH